MGADMAIAWVPSCEIDDDRRHKLQEIIEALADKDLADKDLADLLDYDGDLEDWKAELTDAVDWLCDERTRRDIAGHMIIGGGYPVHITGGMTHGEDPTDAYEYFDRIGQCDKLFAKLEEWAREDAEPAYPPAVQALVEAAQSLLADACDRGECFPESDEDNDYPVDEDGDKWYHDYFALREALKPFDPKPVPAPAAQTE